MIDSYLAWKARHSMDIGSLAGDSSDSDAEYPSEYPWHDAELNGAAELLRHVSSPSFHRRAMCFFFAELCFAWSDVMLDVSLCL